MFMAYKRRREMPKVSIIIPVYKYCKELSKCIDSVLAQTLTDTELLIVENGSVNVNKAIEDDFADKDPRVRVIHMKKGDKSNPREVGILQSTGDYILFLDSRVYIDERYIEEMYEIAEQTNAKLVISGYTIEYSHKNRNQSYKVVVNDRCFDTMDTVRDNIHNYFDNLLITVSWNKLYSKHYIHEISQCSSNSKCDDIHFNMEVIRNIDCVTISSSVGIHIFTSNLGFDSTNVFEGIKYHEIREQFKSIISMYKEWNLHSKIVRKTLYGYYASRLIQCVQEIAVNDSHEKTNQIRMILMDKETQKAFRYGKLKSMLLWISAIPIRGKSVIASIVMGKALGIIKSISSSFFYKTMLKSFS